MQDPGLAKKWSFWLPAAGLLVGIGLVVISVAAHNAFLGRHELAIEGRHLRLAHRIEGELREMGEDSAEEILTRGLEGEEDFVSGLILGAEGDADRVSVGDCGGSATLEVELFLGRGWASGQRGPGIWGGGPRGAQSRGRRTLEIYAPPAALRLSAAEAWLLPSAIAAAILITGLSILGGVLLERQRYEAEREAQRRRLEGLGRAGAGLAHQLRTPLATIKGSCQLLMEDSDAPCGRRFEAVLEQSERMERLVEDLLDYARPPSPEKRTLLLNELLLEIGDRDSRVRNSVEEELSVQADPDHLRQVLDNLLDNAIELSDGEVEVSARRVGSEVEIRVADRGPGPGEDPEHLFEPYVTGRANGVGLGLPIARALTEANGGSVVLAARDGGGTEAFILLSEGGDTP